MMMHNFQLFLVVPFETENSLFFSFFQFKFLVLLIFLCLFFFFVQVRTHFRMKKQKWMMQKVVFKIFATSGRECWPPSCGHTTEFRLENVQMLEHTRTYTFAINLYFICDEWSLMECYKSMALTPDTWMFCCFETILLIAPSANLDRLQSANRMERQQKMWTKKKHQNANELKMQSHWW